ncbi:unnamed protein product [Moneuplotes crassus]|uniref:Tubulin binding cofactor C-like domain-containing protein n=1 Tax=Euplotes crassus TaxID=5936 RepID=A0AAD1U7R3_EUPCR|nr:unnamed protein product [Moneuplotes crassus]
MESKLSEADEGVLVVKDKHWHTEIIKKDKLIGKHTVYVKNCDMVTVFLVPPVGNVVVESVKSVTLCIGIVTGRIVVRGMSSSTLHVAAKAAEFRDIRGTGVYIHTESAIEWYNPNEVSVYPYCLHDKLGYYTSYLSDAEECGFSLSENHYSETKNSKVNILSHEDLSKVESTTIWPKAGEGVYGGKATFDKIYGDDTAEEEEYKELSGPNVFHVKNKRWHTETIQERHLEGKDTVLIEGLEMCTVFLVPPVKKVIVRNVKSVTICIGIVTEKVTVKGMKESTFHCAAKEAEFDRTFETAIYMHTETPIQWTNSGGFTLNPYCLHDKLGYYTNYAHDAEENGFTLSENHYADVKEVKIDIKTPKDLDGVEASTIWPKAGEEIYGGKRVLQEIYEEDKKEEDSFDLSDPNILAVKNKTWNSEIIKRKQLIDKDTVYLSDLEMFTVFLVPPVKNVFIQNVKAVTICIGMVTEKITIKGMNGCTLHVAAKAAEFHDIHRTGIYIHTESAIEWNNSDGIQMYPYCLHDKLGYYKYYSRDAGLCDFSLANNHYSDTKTEGVNIQGYEELDKVEPTAIWPKAGEEIYGGKEAFDKIYEDESDA